MNNINIKTFEQPEWQDRTILQFMFCKTADENTRALIDECKGLVDNALKYRVCYSVFPVSVSGDEIDMTFAKTRSASLAKNLAGCEYIVLFAATAGVEMDRLIERYLKISPAKSMCLGAIGGERVEALCDEFNNLVIEKAGENGYTARPRFSPGYGDLDLGLQRDIFAHLDLTRKMGMTLGDNLLMSPRKSVTAIIGLKPGEIIENT